MKRVAILFLVALFALCALAPRGECAIQSIDSLAEIEGVDAHTLVVLDIDDTLLYYPYDLGSELWFREAWENINALSDTEARQQAIARFHSISALLAEELEVAPVEEITAKTVASWQSTGQVFAITARALEHSGLEDWQGKTVEQLASVGLHFGGSAPAFVGELATPRPSAYRDGVLFSASNNKGTAISMLIDQMEERPERVILIDDRKSDLESAQEALEQAGIPFCGYLYEAQAPRYAAYDSAAAARQLHLLLDRQADHSSAVATVSP